MKLKLAWCALVALSWTACQKAAEPAPPPPERKFVVNGVVKELEADGKSVVIQHEAISNYMGAMTMTFEVHDANVLKDLKAGDAITFDLVVTSNEGWVDGITVRQHAAEATPAPAPPAVTITPAVAGLDEGDLLPDYHFTNELGQPVSLSQYKGQVMAFTFFFTSCPYPTFCPRLTGNFAETAAQLRQTPGAPAKWRLFSITFDPKTDTPQHLLDYAINAHYDAEHWSFLTGDPEQISELADQFGEVYSRAGSTISHNLRTVVIDPHGVVRKIYEGNTWNSADLVQEMVKAAGM